MSKITHYFIIIFSLFFLVVNKSIASSSLGCNPISNTTNYERPNLAKPDYLKPYIDPVFGSKITRITGDFNTNILDSNGQPMFDTNRVDENGKKIYRTWPETCRHYYSKHQPWNADQSIIWLAWCGYFLDGNSYYPIKLKTPPKTDGGGDYARWHPTDPNIMIYLKDNRIGYWNPKTGVDTVIQSFPEYSKLWFGPYEGILSNDGSVVALYSSDKKEAFAYNLNTRTKYPSIDLSSYIEFDWVSINSDGKYIIVVANDRSYIYSLEGQRVGPDWSEFACPSHFDTTIDTNGDPIAVGVCKLSSQYQFIKRNLITGEITNIAKNGWASHTSARNLGRQGYVYASNPWVDPYKNELLSIKIDGTVIERLAWIPNTWHDYPTETQAVSSPDGKKIILASNWGLGYRPISTYIVEPCPSSSPSPKLVVGDATGEGDVNLFDFSVIVNNYNKSTTNGFVDGDFNLDQKVDGQDYILWLNSYK